MGVVCETAAGTQSGDAPAGDLFGLMPGRVTYVFDKTGTCVLSFHSALNAQKHVNEAIAAIKALPA